MQARSIEFGGSDLIFGVPSVFDTSDDVLVVRLRGYGHAEKQEPALS
jgi:hypothetical protein